MLMVSSLPAEYVKTTFWTLHSYLKEGVLCTRYVTEFLQKEKKKEWKGKSFFQKLKNNIHNFCIFGTLRHSSTDRKLTASDFNNW